MATRKPTVATKPRARAVQRRSDRGQVRVDRTIPLWGIVTGVALLVGQAFVVIGTQQRQGDKIDTIATQVTTVVTKVDQITATTTQVQGQIIGLQNRMSRIEGLQDAQRGNK